MVNDIVERILEILQERGISEYQLCKACHINQSTFTTWKSENRVPHTMRLKVIAEYLNVSLDYLVNGKNENEVPDTYYDDEAKQIAQALYERPELKTLFKTTQKVTAEDLKVIQQMVDVFAKRKEE